MEGIPGVSYTYTLAMLRDRCEVTSRGCWEWQGTRWAKGYGRKVIAGKQWQVHRIACILAHGPSPLLALHKCDNPPCANPDHLYWGTHRDNQLDRQNPGRHGI